MQGTCPKGTNMKPVRYSDAGVDIEKGDAFASYIAKINSPAVSKAIGGFAGGIELDLTGVSQPVMLSSTDGVGTKLLVARKLKKYDTLGIDLVAMCVNDLIVAGVRPQVFLDYIACGKIEEHVLQELITGIVTGCEQAQCILAGGETAEMPDVYQQGDFDLAGFCTGVGEKSRLLPKKEALRPGDLLFGLPSVGIHSNGLSLARKAIDENNASAWEQLLVPTKIYVQEMSALLESNTVLAAAHITGGGIEGNVSRILPEGLHAEFHWNWEVPEIFSTIQSQGTIDTQEMRKVFNMGLGVVLACSKDDAPKLRRCAQRNAITLLEVGELRQKASTSARING